MKKLTIINRKQPKMRCFRLLLTHEQPSGLGAEERADDEDVARNIDKLEKII